MKKIISISSVFIGLVIGAGFASGREIFQFFCIPSRRDISGIIVATVSFGATCFITMSLSRKRGTATFDDFIREITGRLAPIVQAVMTLFMFCGFFIMMSACGVLATDTFSLPSSYGILFLATVCFVVFSFNVKGLVVFNTILVPVMIGGMLFICLMSALVALPAFASAGNIITNPAVSALCYVSYNTITAGAVLIPLSATATNKQILSSAIISGTVLGILILSTWMCMNLLHPWLDASEMPLLELASRESRGFQNFYTAILFMALCTTAVSHGFGILSKFRFRKPSHRVAAAALLCLSAVPFANLSFSTLISNIYTLFGYLGIFWMFALILKYLKN